MGLPGGANEAPSRPSQAPTRVSPDPRQSGRAIGTVAAGFDAPPRAGEAGRGRNYPATSARTAQARAFSSIEPSGRTARRARRRSRSRPRVSSSSDIA